MALKKMPTEEADHVHLAEGAASRLKVLFETHLKDFEGALYDWTRLSAAPGSSLPGAADNIFTNSQSVA